MSEKLKNIESLQDALSRLENNESVVYFLAYDTKGNARAAIKYIYDMALITKQNGFNSKILVEDSSYSGVNFWLGDRYSELEVVSIKDAGIQIKIDDMLLVPEYYANILPQLTNIRCVKIMIAQQKDYMFETLPIGSRWSDFGFDKVITTTSRTRDYIQLCFPESLTYVVPPIIDEIFKPTEEPTKPYIAISCRDRMQHRKIISEFYIRYPQLRWITFRDMVQMTYEEFADSLKECFVSLWVDNESTFGTFPLESMKCGIPVVGKIPDTEPDWLSENGMWTYDMNKIVELLGTYTLAWLEGSGINADVKQKMKDTLLPYNKETTTQNILSIFNSFKSRRQDTIAKNLEKLKSEENA